MANRYDRIKKALSLQQPDDKVPCYEGLLSCAQHVLGHHLTTNEDFARAAGESERERLRGQVVEDYIELADTLDWSLIMVYAPFAGPDHLAVISRLRELVDGKIMVGSWVCGGSYTIPEGADLERFCYWLCDEPDEVHERAGQMVKTANEWGKQCIEAGSELVILANDIAFNQGPFLSPKQFSEYVTPYLTEHVSYLKSLGAWVVFHSDGDLMPVLDQIVSSGIHGLNPIDPMAGMDIAEVKRMYGDKIALFGNVQCDLVHRGTPESISQSARYALESAKQGGGLVYCTSSEVFEDTPWENYQAVIDARNKWGNYAV